MKIKKNRKIALVFCLILLCFIIFLSEESGVIMKVAICPSGLEKHNTYYLVLREDGTLSCSLGYRLYRDNLKRKFTMALVEESSSKKLSAKELKEVMQLARVMDVDNYEEFPTDYYFLSSGGWQALMLYEGRHYFLYYPHSYSWEMTFAPVVDKLRELSPMEIELFAYH